MPDDPSDTPDRSEIVVRGSAEGRAVPDRALIVATVEADARARDDAFGRAAEIAAAVDAVTAGHEDAVDRAITTELTVQPLRRWQDGGEVRTGWRAMRRTSIELVRFDRLGDLLADLSAAGAALAGPTWSIDPGNPIHHDVRRAAAADARSRAEDYAAGLGRTVGAVRWVAEPGLGPRPGPGPDGPIVAGPRLAAASMARGDTIEVAPEELTVAASVEVAFSLGS